jgi:uncharacterized protein DUF6572
MAGVADTETIDLVAQDAAGQVLVVMVETRRWGADSAQPAQLRAKLNAYAGFITDGSLLRRYPETAGRTVLIQLDCPEPPAGEFAVVIDHATGKLSQLGVGFRVNIRSPASQAVA